MGRFVGHIAPDALEAALGAMTDSELLAVAFVLEDKSALDGLIDELGLERLEGVLTAAADEGLWPEALDLFVNLSDARRAAIADAAAEADERVLESLAAAVQEHSLWETVLPLVPLLPPDAQQRVAAYLPADVQPAARASEVKSKP